MQHRTGAWRGRFGSARLVALACALVCVAGQARGQVFQMDAARTPLPQPVGMDELSLGRTWGYSSNTMSYFDPTTGDLIAPTAIVYGEYYAPPSYPQFVDDDELTLQGLFKWRGEQIDPVADATFSAGHVFPGCGFEAELVLAGGSCDLALGWYNYVGPSAPPTLADVQALVPRGSTYLNSSQGANGFAPLGWDNRNPRNLSMVSWTPHAFSSGDLKADAHYAGGDIGFVLLADPARPCKSDKFSVYEHNIKNSNGVPWVTAITYRSTKDPTAIYLAFEDLPMAAADWHGAGSQYKNDGDFNDAVFFISGLGATSACPDPTCANVVCDPSTTCSHGSCVPVSPSDGAAGAGDGGASSGIRGDDPGHAGSATNPANEAAGGAAATDSAAAGATHDTPATSNAGAESSPSGADDGGASNDDAAETSKGCGCRFGAKHEPRRVPWLGFALCGVLLLRRRGQNR